MTASCPSKSNQGNKLDNSTTVYIKRLKLSYCVGRGMPSTYQPMPKTTNLHLTPQPPKIL